MNLFLAVSHSANTNTLSALSCRTVKGNWLGKKKQFYVKKPPNAFMLFMRDMRPKVGPEIKSRGSAAVNSFLGEEVSVSTSTM